MHRICTAEYRHTAWHKYGRNSSRLPPQSRRTWLTDSVKALEEGIQQGVWRTRCTTLITWEKQSGITSIKKRFKPLAQPGTAPRVWKTIIGKISPPGTCSCGQDLSIHTNKICPGFMGTKIESDVFLLDSYLRRRRPGVMEKVGGCRFLLHAKAIPLISSPAY